MYYNIICKQCEKEFPKKKKEFQKTEDRSGNHFCSRSCSATYNNSIHKKRKLQGKCKNCETTISSSRKFCDECLRSIEEKRTKQRKQKEEERIHKKICCNCQTKLIEKQRKYCSQECFKLFNKKIKCCKNCGDNISKRTSALCIDCFNEYRSGGFDYTLSEVIYSRHHRSSAYALIRTRARAKAKRLGWCSCSNCDYDKHVQICHIKPIGDFNPTSKISEINSNSNLLPLCPNCHWELDHGLLDINSIRDKK